MLILSLGIWEQEYKIAIESNNPCVIDKDMPRKILENKKGSTSKDEVASEPASEFSSEKRGGCGGGRSGSGGIYQ